MFNTAITSCKYFLAKLILTIPLSFLVLTEEHYKIIWGLVAVICVDTFLGIWVAVKHRIFASYKLSRISNKVVKYSCALLSVFVLSCVEPMAFGWTFQSMGVFLILTEVFSNFEKLSILGLRMPTKFLARLNENFKILDEGDECQRERALQNILNKEQACKIKNGFQYSKEGATKNDSML